MTDRQIIRNEIARINAYMQSDILTGLIEFIDSMQEEPVSEDLEAFIKERVKNIPIVLRSGFHELCKQLIRDGAKWGKQQTITKACDWLKRNADSYTWYNEFEGESGVTEDFVDEFKKEIQ